MIGFGSLVVGVMQGMSYKPAGVDEMDCRVNLEHLAIHHGNQPYDN